MKNDLNRIKMIVTDLDQTLLRSDEKITDYTISVLRRCREKGIKIVFATNRTYRRVTPYLDFTPCDAVICHKGAAIYDGQTKITDLCIGTQTASRILRGLNDKYPHMPIIADSDEKLYANIDLSLMWQNSTCMITDFSDLPGKPVEEIYAGIDCDETLEEIKSFLPDGMDLQKLQDKFIVIMNKKADKLNAIKLLARKHNIDMGQIICFGDYINDIDMIKAAGIGVAVGNALDEVKAAADEIAQSNDNDGVARFIEKLL